MRGGQAALFSPSGVWAHRLIPKGKRFGPFSGEKKKRSQVTSNVYMWEVGQRLASSTLSVHARVQLPLSACVPEVYFPARGWMCVDATDPMKGNWLRYVNWARSSEEQNLFPLEINRAIYYKVLRVSPRRSGRLSEANTAFVPTPAGEVQLNTSKVTSETNTDAKL